MQKNKYPAYRVTIPLSGLDGDLEKWFQHFVKLDTPVAIVGKPKGQKRFTIWIIGTECIAESGSNNREGNKEILQGRVAREANGFNERLNQELKKQREMGGDEAA